MSDNQNKKKISNLFHDCGSYYVSSIEPAIDEPLTVRLRVEKKNVTKAYVEYSTDGKVWESSEMYLDREDATGFYEFFVGTIPGQKKMFKYRFRVGNDDSENEVYYSRTRIGKEAPVFDEKSVKADNCWCMIPGYQSPDWAKGVVWYSAMPDAFYNGDITNDEPLSGNNRANPWNMRQHTLQYKYGGDLKGVERKLDYIRELGCEAVFLDPIFRSSQNAGYGPEFYKQIENSFGNRQALEDLSKAIHDRGLYYMQDVVFMFVENNHVWFDRGNLAPFPGAIQEWDSEYHDFFHFNGEEGDTNSYVSDWGGATLNLANEDLKDLLFRKGDSYLQYYCREPFNIDAIRFDCGGSLSGVAQNGEQVNSVKIMEEIRPYLKKINPEMMLLSEYSMYHEMDSGVWDSRWNLQFVGYALPYMKGDVPESQLFQCFDEEMHNLPRAIGLCQYNSMADHDRPRIDGVQPWAYRAYQLIHMTEIGAPCLYYGDENRTIRRYGTGGSFYAMEWNESIWDYDVFYQTKALTELRKKYPVLRQGLIKYICVDDKEHLFSFARMDEESIVITVASRNAKERSMAIDVRDLGVVDGTVFTDWFTGKQYITKNGYIGVDVQSGGTIFVKGELSTSYKGNFLLSGQGEAKDILLPKENSFQINTEQAFLNRDVFNVCAISANYIDQGGIGMLQIRANDSHTADRISAEIHGATVSVFVKCQGIEKKVAEGTVEEKSRILILRNADNIFDVCTTTMQGALGIPNDKRTNILGACKVIAKGILLDLPNHAKAGICVKEGTALFENVVVEYDKDTILYSDFRKSHSAMFDITPDMDIVYGNTGLTVKPNKKHVKLLTNSYNDDWTFKAELQFEGQAEEEFAGIISQQDENIYVAAGRMYINGRQELVFGRASAGKLVVYHTAVDECPCQNITIQLQRIGTAYTSIYSYDGKSWKMLGKDIIANMCVERVGLMVQGSSSAVYTYASFGNAICDGVSYHTPYTPIEIKTDFAPMNQVVIQPAYRIVSGDWSYADEGYLQTSLGLAQMGISNKKYRGLKVDGTYMIDQGTGYIGFEFGKKSYDSPLGDGILFRLSSERIVSVEKQGNVLGEALLPDDIGQEIKLAMEYRRGTLIVFAGQEGEPVLVIRDMDEVEGYLSYFMEGVRGHINNYLAASFDAEYFYNGNYEKLDFSEFGVSKNWSHTSAFLNLFGVAVTDFVATARFRVSDWGDGGTVGFIIDTPEGKFEKGHALKIVYGAGNDLLLMNGTDIISLGHFTKKTDTHELMIVRKNQKITIYADREKNPCIQYVDIMNNGGVVSLFADKTLVRFEDFQLVNLNPGEEAVQANNFIEWYK